MKPNFDFNDPHIKEAVTFFKIQMEKALAAPQRVESAVFPIFWTVRSPTKPEQIGSGISFQIKGEYFILSASHVFDDIGSYSLLVGTGNGEPLATLSGDRFSSKKGPSGTHIDDKIDASVFHIQRGLTKEIKEAALSYSDLDLNQPDQTGSVFMIAGFRSKKSKTINNKATGNRECFPTIEYSDAKYSLLSIKKEVHIALAYEDQVLIGGAWQKSPTPNGMSGGAVIKVSGVNMKTKKLFAEPPKQLLSAITIEQRREKDTKPGVLIGTRIGVHLGLIDRYLPGLINIEELNEEGIKQGIPLDANSTTP